MRQFMLVWEQICASMRKRMTTDWTMHTVRRQDDDVPSCLFHKLLLKQGISSACDNSDIRVDIREWGMRKGVKSKTPLPETLVSWYAYQRGGRGCHSRTPSCWFLLVMTLSVCRHSSCWYSLCVFSPFCNVSYRKSGCCNISSDAVRLMQLVQSETRFWQAAGTWDNRTHATVWTGMRMRETWVSKNK